MLFVQQLQQFTSYVFNEVRGGHVKKLFIYVNHQMWLLANNFLVFIYDGLQIYKQLAKILQQAKVHDSSKPQQTWVHGKTAKKIKLEYFKTIYITKSIKVSTEAL